MAAGAGAQGWQGLQEGVSEAPCGACPPCSGWVETHRAGGSWPHHTGTRRGGAEAGLVKAAGREEAPGKDSGV